MILTEMQRTTISDAWQLLNLAFPEARGSIRLNFNPGRDFANANLSFDVALEFDGGIIKNLNNRTKKL